MTVLCAVAVGLSVLGSPQITRPIDRYELGDFATRAVRSPYDLSIVDEDATQQQRAAAAANSPIVASIDARVSAALQSRFVSAWAPLAEVLSRAVGPDNGSAAPSRAAEARRQRLRAELLAQELPPAFAIVEQRLGLPVPAEVRDVVQDQSTLQRLLDAFGKLTTEAYRAPVVADASVFQPLLAEGPAIAAPSVVLVDLATGQDSEPRPLDRFRKLPDVRDEVDRLAPEWLPDVAPPAAGWLASVARVWLRPNVLPDETATAARRKAATDTVLPVSLTFRRNQLIVGEGQPVTRQTLLALDALREQRLERGTWRRLAGRTVVILSLLLLAFWTIRKGRAAFAIDTADFSFATTSLVVTLVAFRLWFELVSGATERFPGLNETAAVLAFPATAAVMHASAVLSFRATVTYLAVQSICLGVLWQMDLTLVIYLLVAGTVAGLLVSRCERRQCIVRAGLVAGVAVSPMAVSLALIGDTSPSAAMWTAAGAAAGCTLSGLAAVAVGPVLEWAFGHMTRIRLVELMNYQHPLLRRLTELTPGTFQHSVTIGLLADAGARAIDADALVARVGALYHDVGKTEHPEYFVENQSGVNPHDRMTPRESARLIIGHVDAGVRLVREFGVGERIADFVREHHGTGCVRYFMARAEQVEGHVDPAAFTYPGPRPGSRETGILMIADQVEATARAMDTPTEADLRSMVRATIERILNERQLDECPLTMAELSAIEETFVQVLASVHHRRIKYPPARTG